MSERAAGLWRLAEAQIDGLEDLLSGIDGAELRRPCPGREKLGDGTVAALAAHTVDNYGRIAGFLAIAERGSAGRQAGHRVPGLLRALGHRPPGQGHRRPADHGDSQEYSAASVDPEALLGRLRAARGGIAGIAALADEQLDSIPPEGVFRFCDGRRTLEQVLTGLLKHQGRQVEAIRSAGRVR